MKLLIFIMNKSVVWEMELNLSTCYKANGVKESNQNKHLTTYWLCLLLEQKEQCKLIKEIW